MELSYSSESIFVGKSICQFISVLLGIGPNSSERASLLHMADKEKPALMTWLSEKLVVDADTSLGMYALDILWTIASSQSEISDSLLYEFEPIQHCYRYIFHPDKRLRERAIDVADVLNRNHSHTLKMTTELLEVYLAPALSSSRNPDLKPDIVINSISTLVGHEMEDALIDSLLSFCSAVLKHVLPGYSEYPAAPEVHPLETLQNTIQVQVEDTVKNKPRSKNSILVSILRVLLKVIEHSDRFATDQFDWILKSANAMLLFNVFSRSSLLETNLVAILDHLLFDFESSKIHQLQVFDALVSLQERQKINNVFNSRHIQLLSRILAFESGLWAPALHNQIEDILCRLLYHEDAAIRQAALELFDYLFSKGSSNCFDALRTMDIFDCIVKRSEDQDYFVRLLWLRTCKSLLDNDYTRRILREDNLFESVVTNIGLEKLFDPDAVVRREAVSLITHMVKTHVNEISRFLTKAVFQRLCDDSDSEVRSESTRLLYQFVSTSLGTTAYKEENGYLFIELLKSLNADGSRIVRRRVVQCWKDMFSYLQNSPADPTFTRLFFAHFSSVDIEAIEVHIKRDDDDDALEITKSLIQDTGLLANEEVNTMACYDC
ncbi:hypothetical protein HDU97_000041 [Phlyctochytrium planicorne]|nr:hypothetical protein HDU97_000041 [Phlyctochytrium planicorne]